MDPSKEAVRLLEASVIELPVVYVTFTLEPKSKISFADN